MIVARIELAYLYHNLMGRELSNGTGPLLGQCLAERFPSCIDNHRGGYQDSNLGPRSWKPR